MDKLRDGLVQALIVGGGVAGCALGLFLHKAGISVSIFEAYPRERACSEGTVGGGLQVAPNGMNVLNALGLADHLSAEGVPCHRFIFSTHHGKDLFEASLDDSHHFEHSAVNLKRAALHLALVEEVERQGIPIFYEKRLRSIDGFEDDEGDDQNKGCVVARFEDGTEARANFVVGADGAHSRVRAALFFNKGKSKGTEEEEEGDDQEKLEDEEGLEYLGVMSSGGFVESDLYVGLPEEHQGDMHFTMGPGGRMIGYCRATGSDPRLVMWWRNTYVGFGGKDREAGDNLLNAWKGYCPSKEELQALDIDELKDRILDVPGGWPPEAQKLVRDTEAIFRGTISVSRPLERWYSGRAVLVGDAAHAVSPHSGQGASQALEDAHYLSKVLTVLYDPDNHDASSNVTKAELEEAFQVYQDGRKTRAEMIVAEGKRRGEPRFALGVHEEPPGAVKQWLTEQLVKGIFKIFVLKSFRQILDYQVDLDDCKTLGDIRRKQRPPDSSYGKLLLVACVAVVVVGAVIYQRM